MTPSYRLAQAQEGGIALEALVAFAILVMLLAAGYQALTLGLQSARIVREREAALAEATSFLEQLRTYPASPPASDAGRFASGARWLLQLVPLPAPVGHAPRRYWVSLLVRDERGRELFALQTVILRPAHERNE